MICYWWKVLNCNTTSIRQHFLLKLETYHCALALVSVFQRNRKPLPLFSFTQAKEIVHPKTSYPQVVSVVVFPALRSVIVPAKEQHQFISKLVSAIANWLFSLARVNFKSGFLYSFFEKPFSGIFFILFRASNNQITDENNCTEFSFKTIRCDIESHTYSKLS